MKTQPSKVKILAVGPVQSSYTAKGTTRKLVMSVLPVPDDNPYGAELKGVPLDVEVYNHNIELFGITNQAVNEQAVVELYFVPYKRDANTPAEIRLIVNKLEFVV